MDLNADIGESFGSYIIGNDDAILDYVSSANIACGFHAGDPSVIRKTIELASSKGIHIGAHPGYPDLAGFGRRQMMLSSGELFDNLLYQIAVIKALAENYRSRLHHVKLHGALYLQANHHAPTADIVVASISKIAPDAIVFGLPHSLLEKKAREAKLEYWAEGFADRLYQNDGSLVPRSEPNAVFHDLRIIMGQVERMVLENKVYTRSNDLIELPIRTICVHGDNDDAIHVAKYIKAWLIEQGQWEHSS